MEASTPAISADGMAARKEKARKSAAEAGEKEPRFKEVDLWSIVVQNQIRGETGREELMAYAKKCGGAAMVTFCFKNWSKLPELIDRCWAIEGSEDLVARARRSRLEILESVASSTCMCGGRWRNAAGELLTSNSIPVSEWRHAILESLRNGRSKGSLVCHAGLVGDEGKSFLLQPLIVIYGMDAVFLTPPKSAFPLMGLGGARLALLDDWRFNDDVIPYALQLLWFEGKPFTIARPQNQHSGHTRYTGDAPVFITTLEADITQLKRGLQSGDVEMMLKRLKIFRFHQKLVNPDRSIPPCGHCFARLVLDKPDVQQGQKRPLQETGTSPGDQLYVQCSRSDAVVPSSSASSSSLKPKCKYNVSDVCDFLRGIELGHLAPAFVNNGVDGEFWLS
jgi:hypothetical protein